MIKTPEQYRLDQERAQREAHAREVKWQQENRESRNKLLLDQYLPWTRYFAPKLENAARTLALKKATEVKIVMPSYRIEGESMCFWFTRDSFEEAYQAYVVGQDPKTDESACKWHAMDDWLEIDKHAKKCADAGYWLFSVATESPPTQSNRDVQNYETPERDYYLTIAGQIPRRFIHGDLEDDDFRESLRWAGLPTDKIEEFLGNVHTMRKEAQEEAARAKREASCCAVM